MLLIKTYVGPSAIHGMGVFAAEAIDEGTPIWRYEEGFDPVYPERITKDAPEPIRDYLKKHAYPHPYEKEKIMLDGDYCRYMNHSTEPNVDFARDPDKGFAKRPIAPGTELTCNYAEFAPGWYDI